MKRLAIVTGGTRGIGAGISKALQDAGYTVAANYNHGHDSAQKFYSETGISVFRGMLRIIIPVKRVSMRFAKNSACRLIFW